VAAIGRGDLLKGDAVGERARGEEPFHLLLDTPGGEETAEADVVIDAGGVYGQPNALGRGGVPAPGERALGERIHTGLPDVRGKDRPCFEGGSVLVVGGGLSAATTVNALAGVPGAQTYWVTRGGAPPVGEIPDDPLPARLSVTREANRLADASEGCHHIPHSTVSRLHLRGDAVSVSLTSPSGERTIEVDSIVCQTGFRPDHHIYRELQIHECYASEGPMKLAASLLGQANTDCMAATGFGPESLTHPEPNFFVVGHKSYGRNPYFLLRIGREQIRDVFQLLTGDESLDLYRVGEASGV
jgi:thioredoxin reductase